MSEYNTRKRKNRLAVFQRVSQREKKPNLRKNGFKNEPADDVSELDLVIDDEDDCLPNQQKKRAQGVRLVEEPLKLYCPWNDCKILYTDFREFIKHLNTHAQKAEINDDDTCTCLWEGCKYIAPEKLALVHHLNYHGYHYKLKNIGSNVLERMKLPKCTITTEFAIPEALNGYSCEWADCYQAYSTFVDFLDHIKIHVNSNPKYCKKGEVILCLWIGCNAKFMSQYKLSDHMRSHTKERVIACPTCGSTFATKTKFCDHRRRQLPIELQSYQCSQCSKLFPTERLLRDHMRAHVNHYKCSMCDMTCPKPSILAKHIRYRHLNERPFKCDHCDHACVTKQNLEMHLLTHCTEKLLECEDCEFRCRSAHGLDKHYQLVHGTGYTPIYQCHCCRKEFSRGNFLTRHLMKEHDFHWPSGHSRFRYKEDADGIFRLQTVRYESLEVTQQMMNNTTSQSSFKKITPPPNFSYELKVEQSKDKCPSYIIVVSENNEQNGTVSGEQSVLCQTDNSIVITIDDVDEKGNVVHSETVESNELICTSNGLRSLKAIDET